MYHTVRYQHQFSSYENFSIVIHCLSPFTNFIIDFTFIILSWFTRIPKISNACNTYSVITKYCNAMTIITLSSSAIIIKCTCDIAVFNWIYLRIWYRSTLKQSHLRSHRRYSCVIVTVFLDSLLAVTCTNFLIVLKITFEQQCACLSCFGSKFFVKLIASVFSVPTLFTFTLPSLVISMTKWCLISICL